MLKNHLKIAFRQLKKQKFYSAVNIIGLAIGVTCCLLITLFIRDELSYDNYHPDSENLYRVGRDMKINDDAVKAMIISAILPKALTEQIPEIKNYARIQNDGSNLVRKVTDKDNLFEDGFIYADQSLFELFDLPLIHGEKNNILTKPNTIVVSERIAQKYFPNRNPVGELLILNDDLEQTFTVSGVMENIPEQTHVQADFFLSMPTIPESQTSTSYINNSYFGYVSLVDGTQPKDLESKLRDFVIRNVAPQYKEVANIDLLEIEKQGSYHKIFLQPIKDVHLKSGDLWPTLPSNGDIRYVWLFGVIAIFILIIALFNFINLSTARSANRAKEVGLRKVLGSFQKQLVTQFLTESTLMSLFAFAIGSLFAVLLLPTFNELTGKNLSIPFTEISFLPIFIGCALVAGVLAGLYPAFYLSGFKPVKVLKGKLSLGSKNGWFQSSLVVVQFAISIGLIVGTLVVQNQMDFIQNKKLGFEKDQVLIIQDTYTLEDQIPAFKDALKKLPEVKDATATPYLPLDGGQRRYIMFHPEENAELAGQVQLQAWTTDEDYLNTLNIQLKSGRNFNPEMPTDTNAVILNETAVRSFGLTGNPVGQRIKTPAITDQNFTIVGVVEDFHFESLKGKIGDVGFFYGNNAAAVSIKSTAAEMDQLIAKTENVWKTFAPNQPFRYDFLDDRFATMYQTEDRVGALFGIFSLLAISIACLGLLALATFMTEQRMKEIGIRKVLGASVPDIVFQLSKKFLLYVIIGLLIAAPIAYLQMSEWLNNFEYRIEIEWWMIGLAGALAIGIAFLTVGSKTLVAALSNPVESLRNE